ncbi:hypothetical protein IJ818_03115 [bacterium]|nr:hypothetical protein [bacterium]
MKQILIITIIAAGLYFAYTNWDKINTTISTSTKNERTVQTIKAINESRANLNTEAQEILDNN